MRLRITFQLVRASLVAQTVKNLPAMQEAWVRSLGWEDPLEEGMATHSNILAWKIHRQSSLAGYSPGGRKELDTTEQLSIHAQTEGFPGGSVVKNLPTMQEPQETQV